MEGDRSDTMLFLKLCHKRQSFTFLAGLLTLEPKPQCVNSNYPEATRQGQIVCPKLQLRSQLIVTIDYQVYDKTHFQMIPDLK